MQKQNKKFLAWLLTLCMVLTLVPAFVLPVAADTIIAAQNRAKDALATITSLTDDKNTESTNGTNKLNEAKTASNSSIVVADATDIPSEDELNNIPVGQYYVLSGTLSSLTAAISTFETAQGAFNIAFNTPFTEAVDLNKGTLTSLSDSSKLNEASESSETSLSDLNGVVTAMNAASVTFRTAIGTFQDAIDALNTALTNFKNAAVEGKKQTSSGPSNNTTSTYTPPPLTTTTDEAETAPTTTTTTTATEVVEDIVIGGTDTAVTVGYADEGLASLLETVIEDNETEFVIDLTGEDFVKAESFGITLPTAVFAELELDTPIIVTIATSFGSISISSDTLLAMMKVAGEKLTFSLTKGSFIVSILDEKNRAIEWNDPDNPMMLTLPYELGDDENADYVIAVRVAATGNNIPVPLGVYKDGFISFEITRTGTYNVIYNDVMDYADAEGHWAEEYISFLAARGLLEAGEEFGVETQVTRAMFAVMFAAIERANLNSYSQQTFTDVATNRSFFRAIEWAADVGIINGIGGGLFAPNRLVSREEMATMLNRYIDYKLGAVAVVEEAEEVDEDEADETAEEADENEAVAVVAAVADTAAEFADAALISDWAVKAVEVIVELEIIVGKPGNIFDPKGITTKAEYAAIFARLIKALS